MLQQLLADPGFAQPHRVGNEYAAVLFQNPQRPLKRLFLKVGQVDQRLAQVAALLQVYRYFVFEQLVEALQENDVRAVFAADQLGLFQERNQLLFIINGLTPEALEPLPYRLRGVTLLMNGVKLGIVGQAGAGEVGRAHDGHVFEDVSFAVKKTLGVEAYLHLGAAQELYEVVR